MGLSKREGVRARTWRSGGDAGAFAYPSQPSTTMWLSFSGPPSYSGDDRHPSIARRSSARSLHWPMIRLRPIATLERTSSPACARSMLHGKADEDDVSSSIARRASARSTSCGFCTIQWTSAGMFRMIRRLADRSEDVELMIYCFDTHLTPNVANFAEFGRRRCRVGSSQKPENEFKTAHGGPVRLA